MTLTVGSLFSGIEGLGLGLERAGMTVRWQSEIDPYCCRVLARHWPGVPNLGDVTAVDWSTVERVDVIAAGYPCPAFSLAGRRRGADDPRYLWPVVRDALRHLRPRYAVLENVPGHLTLGFDRVLADLAELGFDAEWSTVSACSLGAPHVRSRLFVVAYADSVPAGHGHDGAPAVLAHTPRCDEGGGHPLHHSDHWNAEPDVDRVAPRISARVDRLRALGNSVVPQVAELVGRRVMEMASCS